MPKIREYNQQFEAQSQNLNSNADLMGSGLGKSVERLGGAVMNVAEANYKRQAQNEVSDLSAKFSEARAEWSVRIDEETRNGTINTDKVSQEYQDSLSKLADGIETTEGQDFFNRQSAGLGGFVLKNSARGQAAVAGAKAEESIKTTVQNNANTLMGDPSHFQEIYDSNIHAIDAQTELGTIPAAQADKLKASIGKELSLSTVVGWAQLNPDFAEKKLNSGDFDKYLDSDNKRQMFSYINQARNAKEADAVRADRLAEKAKKARTEAKLQSLFAPMVKNELSADDVIKMPDLPFATREHLISRIKQGDKEAAQGNYRLQNEMFEKMNLPETDPNRIQTPSQLLTFTGQDGSRPNMADITRMSTMLDKSPQGVQLRQDRGQVLNVVKGSGGILEKDTMGVFNSGFSSDSQRQLQRFLQDAHEEEAKVAAEGKDIHKTLYDPNSKDYIASPERLLKYKTPLHTKIESLTQAAAQDRLKEQGGSAIENDKLWKAGDTLESWKARQGGK